MSVPFIMCFVRDDSVDGDGENDEEEEEELRPLSPLTVSSGRPVALRLVEQSGCCPTTAGSSHGSVVIAEIELGRP